MRVRLSLLAALCGAALLLAPHATTRLHAQEGWISLFDGKSLDGWKVGENAATFSVQDGAIVVFGPRAHLYYMGRWYRKLEDWVSDTSKFQELASVDDGAC